MGMAICFGFECVWVSDCDVAPVCVSAPLDPSIDDPHPPSWHYPLHCPSLLKRGRSARRRREEEEGDGGGEG